MEVVFQIIEFKQPKSVRAQGFVYLVAFKYLFIYLCIYLFICAAKLIVLIMSKEMSLTRTLTRADCHSFVHINLRCPAGSENGGARRTASLKNIALIMAS